MRWLFSLADFILDAVLWSAPRKGNLFPAEDVEGPDETALAPVRERLANNLLDYDPAHSTVTDWEQALRDFEDGKLDDGLAAFEAELIAEGKLKPEPPNDLLNAPGYGACKCMDCVCGFNKPDPNARPGRSVE